MSASHNVAAHIRATERLTERPTVCIVTEAAAQAQATEETMRHARHRVLTVRHRRLIRKSGFVAQCRHGAGLDDDYAWHWCILIAFFLYMALML